jgi:cation transporter-like permease
MTKAAVIAVVLLGLAAVAGFFGWAFYAMEGAGSWTGGSSAIMTIIVAGALVTGGLAGVLMWLAFYSSRKGYDELPHYDGDAPPGAER